MLLFPLAYLDATSLQPLRTTSHTFPHKNSFALGTFSTIHSLGLKQTHYHGDKWLCYIPLNMSPLLPNCQGPDWVALDPPWQSGRNAAPASCALCLPPSALHRPTIGVALWSALPQLLSLYLQSLWRRYVHPFFRRRYMHGRMINLYKLKTQTQFMTVVMWSLVEERDCKCSYH